MKRRFFFVFCLLFMLAACAFGFAACGENSDPNGNGNGNGGGNNNEPPAHVHEMEYFPSQTATCLEEGNVEYWFCAGCGKYFADEQGTDELKSYVIPATGHQWSDWELRREATCAEEGENFRKCENCGMEETEPIAKIAHTMQHFSEKSASCTETGVMEHYYCSDCGQYFYDELGEQKADPEDLVIQTTYHPRNGYGEQLPTCTVPGHRPYFQCTVCNKYFLDSECTQETTWDELVIPAAHQLTHVALKEFSCYEDGNIEYWACSACDKYFEDENAEKEIADKSSVILPAHHTFTDGWKIIDEKHWRVCKVCETVCDEDVHSMADGECEICGYKPAFTYGLSYEIINGGSEYQVIGAENVEEKDIVIPAMYNGLPVTRIESMYSSNNNFTQSVTIPGSIKSIGSIAFQQGYNGLTAVYYQGSIAQWCNIEFEWFDANPVRYANNLYIDGEMVTDVTIPSDMDTIGAYTFCGMSELERVTIPASIKEIGVEVFSECSSDLILNYEGDIAQWCNILFNDSLAEHAFYVKGKPITALIVPDGVTEINPYAFSWCTGLLSVEIPESVLKIGERAFFNCFELQEITLPFIGESRNGEQPFDYIFGSSAPRSLKSVTVTDADMIDDSAFYDCRYIEEIYFPGVESIGAKAFYGCEALASIDLTGVKTIGEYAFYHAGLLALVVPDSVETIGYRAFANCRRLSEVTIAPSVQTMGDEVFDVGGAIKSLTIPFLGNDRNDRQTRITDILGSTGSLISVAVTDSPFIPERAFAGCNTLVNVEIGSGTREIGFGAFENCSSIENMTIPFIGQSYDGTGSTDLNYIYGGEPGSGYTKYFPKNLIINGSGAIPAYAVPDNKRLETVTFSDAITSIGDFAFQYSSSLTEIRMGNESLLESIGERAFGGCASLQGELVFPNNLVTIGDNAFVGCSLVEKIVIGRNVRYIGTSAFSSCDSVTSICYEGDIAEWCNIVFEGRLDPLTDNNAQFYLKGELLTDLVIPSSVHEIPSNAFAGFSQLKSITIESGVKKIGSAFKDCLGITEITVPDSVTEIGNYAFENCNNLEKITLPFASGVSSLGNLFDGYNGRLSPSLKTVVITGGTAVGDEFFQGCKTLEKIELSESIKTIGDYAFADCNAELEVNIPYGIESIGAYAFNNCKFLTDFNSKSEKKFDSLKTIGDYAFAGCTNLERVTFPNSLTSIGRNVLQNSGVQWLSLPFIGETREKSERLRYLFDINNSSSNSGIDSLKGVDVTDAETISDTAFSGYKNLINVSLNEGIIKIGVSAFKNCTALQTVKLPATLKYINDGAFQNCAGITAIELPQDLLYLGANVFTGCGEGLITESYGLYYVGGWIVGYSENVPSDILLYDNVRGVASEAFDGADIRSIDLDTSTQSIGDNAFRNCHQLEEVYFRGTIKYLGEYAFENCNALSSINLNGVSDKELREGMFSGCSSLKDVTLSIFITTIADSVFAGCESLEEILIPDQVVSIGEDVFSGCINLQKIMVEAGNSFYETIDDCLVESSTGVLLYGVNRSFLSGSLNGVTAIADNAFAGMQGLEYFIMPDTLKSIGKNAFADSGLIKIVISANVTSIAGSAFTGCDALASIEVEDGNSVYHSYKNSLIETESKTLVLGCSASEIPADGSVTVIGDYAFYNCSGLTSVSIPEGVTAIGNYAFSNCGITGILSLPESLVTIGDHAFEMGRFTEVVIPANVTDLGVYAFNQCYSLKKVTFEEGSRVEFISEAAFNLCGIEELILPEGLKVIGNRAFASNNLTEIIIPDSVESIGTSAFVGNSSANRLLLSANIKEVWWGAFDLCSFDEVFFKGTEQQWNALSFGIETKAMYFYSETPPTDDGNYWHYAEDGKTPIIWSKGMI